nr:hypothetical protein [Pseudidiomarina sp. 1APP75-27a]
MQQIDRAAQDNVLTANGAQDFMVLLTHVTVIGAEQLFVTGTRVDKADT